MNLGRPVAFWIAVFVAVVVAVVRESRALTHGISRDGRELNNMKDHAPYFCELQTAVVLREADHARYHGEYP